LSSANAFDMAAGVPAEVAQLRCAAAVRRTCSLVFEHVRQGQSAWWRFDESALDHAVDVVVKTTLSRYPDLQVPFHSRFRHFEANGINRLDRPNSSKLNSAQRAAMHIDLVVVSVLLDAGAGAQWRYREASTGQVIGRSEGLGVASLVGFEQGLFSSNPLNPHQVDAQGLLALDEASLAAMFQVSQDNPLVGLPGRLALLHSLGKALIARPQWFGTDGRPGGLFTSIKNQQASLAAADLLDAVLHCFSDIWPSANQLFGVAVGDCWPWQFEGNTTQQIAFHKLSQWLTYSLLEPFMQAGIEVTDLDGLTGLPEYRNGGLMIDARVLQPLDPQHLQQPWHARDPLIIEWRACTVMLLDEIARRVSARLGKVLPLAAVLEGGTWAAGRVLAAARNGQPPLNIVSDGTVF
jgi:Protein of unknown function (DUF1688)